MKKAQYLIPLFALFLACSDDDEGTPLLEVPTTYEFTRGGESSVSFQGQTDRLNMLSEIKTEVRRGDAGEVVSAQTLRNMFANENSPFADTDLNSSTKQLEDKTFAADVSFYNDLFDEVEAISSSSADVDAEAGVAGRIERGTSGNFILVNEKGHEFTQFIEKGLIGSVFHHQIYNVYLTDDRVGDDVDNITIEEGENYTAMEHHWDEAFGYWGVPVDFPDELSSEDNRFWANYSYSREALTGTASALRDAYLIGRTAIVNNDFTVKNAQRDLLYEQHELVAAATTLHYINDTVNDLNNGDQGNALHHLSEAYMFARAIKFSPRKSLSDTQLDIILEQNFGADGDFWAVTIEGLNAAKATLVAAYPTLADVADDL